MKILYLNGALTGQKVELLPTGTTIGRESDNSIQLPMGGVSRYHAKIECDAAGNWSIRDLGSTNGTLVDDVPVTGAARLVSGSVISIGDQLLRCLDSGTDPAAGQPFSPSQQTAPAQPQSGQAPEHAFFFRPGNVASQPPPTSTSPMGMGAKTVLAPAPAPVSASFGAPTISDSTISRGLFNKKQDNFRQPDHSKKLVGNIVFVLLLLLAVLIGVIAFWMPDVIFYLQRNQLFGFHLAEQPSVGKKVDNPFTLYYEKEAVSGTAVFRFSLLVEWSERNNPVTSGEDEPSRIRGYFMEVTLDEPLNRRRYYELFDEPLSDELVAKLKQQIQDSGFMELQQEKIVGTSQDNRQHRRIMVGFGNKFCDVKVSNDVSETFNRAETIINETLLDEYDLGVISQNVDRILSDARSFLFVAEEAFRSIDTTPSNLPKAITYYKLALRRYRLFDDPKPKEWDAAREGLAKAEARLEEIRQEGSKNVKLFYELSQYDKAIAECNRLLDIFPPDSKQYKAIRETKIKIENKQSLRSN